jgi:hypothetical protein
MYRIELSPGEETAFRSIEELAVAIRRGVVTSKARIWHNASSKWLPIQFHPHYKTAAAMPLTQAELVAGPPVAPLSSLNLPDPASTASRVTPFRPVDPTPQPAPAPQTSRVTPFRPASPYHQPAPHVQPAPAAPPPQVHPATAGLPLVEPFPFVSPPAPLRPEPAAPPPKATPVFKPLAARPQPAMKFPPPAEEPPRQKKRSRSRKPSRRALRVAFIGALLVGGGHLLVNAGAALRTDALRTHRRLVAAPPEAIKRDSPRTVAAVIPTLRNSSVPGGTSKLSQGSRIPTPTIIMRADSGPTIEAAPAVELPAPAPAATDSLASTPVDSTGKKVLKGILRAVSGATENEKDTPKH